MTLQGKEGRGPILQLLFCSAVFLITAVVLSPFIPDDSFISFRYAENLARGHGLTFNPGETPVEGYSNFLWVAVCALVSAAGLNLPRVMPALGIYFGLLSVFVFWLLLRRRQPDIIRSSLLLLLFAGSAPAALYAVSGMETPLFVFILTCLLFNFDFLLSGRGTGIWILFAVLSFLLALCRPEGILFFPLMMILLAAGKKLTMFKAELSAVSYKNMMISLAVFLLLTAAYEAWRINYFGSPLPVPFISKGASSGSFASTWSSNFRNYFYVQNHYYTPAGYYFLALLAAAVYSHIRSRLSGEGNMFFETAALAAALVFSFLYLNFLDWMPGMRYFAAITPLFITAVSPARLTDRLPQERAVRKTDLAFALLLAVLLNASYAASLKFDAERNEAGIRESTGRLAGWIKKHAPANTLVAASDIGAIAYYSDRPVLDINPKPLTDKFLAVNGWSESYFFQRNPGFVVFVSFSMQQPRMFESNELLYKSSSFRQNYSLAGKIRSDWDKDRSYWVFKRNSLVLPEEAAKDFPSGLGFRQQDQTSLTR